jgi:hypothetical protein
MESAFSIYENIKQGKYDLKTQNYGIKTENISRASLIEQGQI